MRKLGERSYQLIARGVRMCGTFDPDVISSVFIEELYSNDVDEVLEFLKWVHNTGRTFGHGNYEQVFAEFKKSKEVAHVQ